MHSSRSKIAKTSREEKWYYFGKIRFMTSAWNTLHYVWFLRFWSHFYPHYFEDILEGWEGQISTLKICYHQIWMIQNSFLHHAFYWNFLESSYLTFSTLQKALKIIEKKVRPKSWKSHIVPYMSHCMVGTFAIMRKYAATISVLLIKANLDGLSIIYLHSYFKYHMDLYTIKHYMYFKIQY